MLISRDPFARQELHRSTVTGSGDVDAHRYACANCGYVRRTPKRHRPYAYVYETQSDGGRIGRSAGVFCSKSCHDSYHYV